MASAKIYQMDGTESGTVELNPAVFDVKMNATLVHDVAVALMNAKRQGNAETKTRSDVSGGGRKPYRQKGTGNARRGSIREPHMRGGGTVFGPHKRSYRQKVPRTFKAGALKCMLSDRVRHDNLLVLESLQFDQPKTKPFVGMMKRLHVDGAKLLFVTAEPNGNALLSGRNVPGVQFSTAENVNTLDVLGATKVVVVRDALSKLEERLS